MQKYACCVRDAWLRGAFFAACACLLRVAGSRYTVGAVFGACRRSIGAPEAGSCCCKEERAVKKIVAIIQPSKFEAVKDALIAIGIDGMTASEARGFGRQKGHKEVFRGREYIVDLLPKIQLEVVVASERSEEVIRTVIAAARTGRIGDGKIFVYDLVDAIRIRNEERGDSAV
jgi:nitrogen regulatory protein P-II 1